MPEAGDDQGVPGRRYGPAVAIGVTAAWVLGAGGFVLFGDASARWGAVALLVGLIGIAVPLVLVWSATQAHRAFRDLADTVEALRRSEADRAALPAATPPPAADADAGVSAAGIDAIGTRIEDIARSQRQTEAALARFLSTRPAPETPAPPADTGQQVLSFEDEAAEAPPVSLDDVIAALQFPVDAEDRAGFRAMRRAMQNHRVAQLIVAAQDVLTLLSQDGIYMDDVIPDRARPDLWRSFAGGMRGPAVSDIGGIHDREWQETVTARMRVDAIFRDACHHFLRLFDHIFAEIEPEASDAELARLADTRSARAFMLLGRAAGTFD